MHDQRAVAVLEAGAVVFACHDASLHFANKDGYRDDLLTAIERARSRFPTLQQKYGDSSDGLHQKYGDGSNGHHHPYGDGSGGRRAGYGIRAAVLDIAGLHGVDAPAIQMLKDLCRQLRADGVAVLLCGCDGNVKAVLRATGVFAAVGMERVFDDLPLALDCAYRLSDDQRIPAERLFGPDDASMASSKVLV
jgi:hypothetical protein